MSKKRVVHKGPLKWYFDDGSLKMECPFRDGQPDGLYREWRCNGKLWLEKILEKGNVRLLREWNTEGALRSEAFYYFEKGACEIKTFTPKSGRCKVRYMLGGKTATLKAYTKAIHPRPAEPKSNIKLRLKHKKRPT